MKRWIELVARLYPPGWREEFGVEFGALLDDVRPGWRVFMNVLRGAIEMQVTEGTNWWKLAGGMAVVGALVAAGLSFTMTPHYVSTAVVSVTPQPDPVRPASPEVLQQRAADHVAEMESEILSRLDLYTIINDPRLLLYTEELKRKPLLDVIEQMRHDIRIEAQPSTVGGPVVFSISFSYPDQIKAQAVVRELSRKFTELNRNSNQRRADAYRGFWEDMVQARQVNAAPPPPPGETVQVIAAASPSQEASGSRHILFPAWGLGVGLALGLMAAFAIRWRGRAWRLAGFAASGFVLAACLSYFIPNRYASSAVMMIRPAAITEDPLTVLGPATPAAEFLRQTEPGIVSFESLLKIIEDPRLNLYSGERKKKPMEEIVRNMRDNDLRIAVLPATAGAKGAASAFSITFSYSDRFKAQLAVQALMNAFDEHNLVRLLTNSSANVLLHQIAQRKAGEVLDVLDTASLPVRPVKPNRLVIAMMGLMVGLLGGAFQLFRKRPVAPGLLTLQSEGLTP